MRAMLRSSLSLALALALLAPLPGLGQGQNPPRPAIPAPDAAESVFGETIEVRVVNLEAVVVDKQGNRVHGLKPQDYRLLIDGKPTSIDYFTEVALVRQRQELVIALYDPVSGKLMEAKASMKP